MHTVPKLDLLFGYARESELQRSGVCAPSGAGGYAHNGGKKFCNGCKLILPVSEFEHHTTKVGNPTFRSRCKECELDRKQKNRECVQKNRDERRAAGLFTEYEIESRDKQIAAAKDRARVQYEKLANKLYRAGCKRERLIIQLAKLKVRNEKSKQKHADLVATARAWASVPPEIRAGRRMRFESWVNTVEGWASKKRSQANARARLNNRVCSLTVDELIKLREATGSDCPCCGQEMDFSVTGRSSDRNNASLDRIDSTKGYESENVAIICWKCNSLKSNATWQELLAVGNWLKDRAQQQQQLRVIADSA